MSRLTKHITRAEGIAAQLRAASDANPLRRLSPLDKQEYARYLRDTPLEDVWANEIDGKGPLRSEFRLSDYGLTAQSTEAEFSDAYQRVLDQPAPSQLRAKLRRIR